MVDDRKEFVEWITNRNDPDYEYNRLKRIVDSDTRVNKTIYSDIKASAKDVIKFQKSETYRNVGLAKELIPNFEIEESALRSAMTSTYKLSNSEYQECLRQLANDKEINIRRSTFQPNNIKISKR